MVLDVKAMGWAARNNLETAKLKKARVPVYGKWYYPEIPAGVRVVNLHTGEVTSFDRRMIAGEILYAPEEELRRAGLLPEASTAPAETPPEDAASD